MNHENPFRLLRFAFVTSIGFLQVVSAAAVVEFAAKPTVSRSEQTITIRFEVSGETDVEVAILDGESRIVRHLAAGVLGGENSPPAPLSPGLSQTMKWDGRDDSGQRVANVDRYFVRVRVGMGVRLDRIVGGDPYAFYSREMGQGDHAAWHISGLEAKADGHVYVLGNANNYGPAALRKYDAAGNYLATVYPPPAGKPKEKVSGWGILTKADGTYTFQYNDLDSPALSKTFLSGNRGRIATLIPSPNPQNLLLTRNGELMRVHTDGTIPASPLLEGSLVNQPAMAPPGKNPKRGSWRLTGQMQTCVAADRQSFFLSGLFAGTLDRRGTRIGAEPNGFWRDGQIYQVDYQTRTARVFFALDPSQVITDQSDRNRSPIADARYGNYAALQGVATDRAGRVFVCDRQNERVLVLDPTGKILRQIPLLFPDAIAVHPTSNAIYVTTRTGHFHGKGQLKLLKFADWRKDKHPATMLPLCEVHHYSHPTYLAVAEHQGKAFVWVAYTALPVRIYQDRNQGLELVKDFYKAGKQRALDLQHCVVDPKTEDLYVADGFDRCFRITDWSKPQFVRCLQDSETPLEGLSLAIDSRNRWLYSHADREPVRRYRLDGKYLTPAPLGDSPGNNAFTPKLTNDWRIGLGHGERGIAAAPDGSLATLAALGTGPNYGGSLRFFRATPTNAPWESVLFTSFGENVRAAGVRFDLKGNLYVGKTDDAPIIPPVGFEKDANLQKSTGRIYKYSPTGSLTAGKLFPSSPAEPAKIYDIPYGAIGPRFARTPRFGVDGFGRIYYPSSLLNRVSVIDNEGNPISTFGTYGNRDSLGGLPGDLVPTQGIPLAWPSSVDATDDSIYVSDIVNIRVLRIAKTFALSHSVTIP